MGETWSEKNEGRRCAVMLALCEHVANDMHDGHFTLLRFTTGWKCCFGTPEPFRERVAELTTYKTASEAMARAIMAELELSLPF